VSNLTVACEACNQSKNNLSAAEFGHPNIQKQALRPLKDAAAVKCNSLCHRGRTQDFGIYQYRSGPVAGLSSIALSRAIRKPTGLTRACVGESGNQVKLDLRMQVWQVKATGHGSRQMCRMDRFGFPGLRLKQLVRLRVLGLATWFSR